MFRVPGAKFIDFSATAETKKGRKEMKKYMVVSALFLSVGAILGGIVPLRGEQKVDSKPDGFVVFECYGSWNNCKVIDPSGVETESKCMLGSDPEDFDCDGALDVLDNCPMTSNADQSDRDRDGIGDACDLCGDQPAYQPFAGAVPGSPAWNGCP